MTPEKLIRLAEEAMTRAYAPYSRCSPQTEECSLDATLKTPLSPPPSALSAPPLSKRSVKASGIFPRLQL